MIPLTLITIMLLGFATARPPVKGKESRDEFNPDYIVAFKSQFDLRDTTLDVIKSFPTFKVIPKLKYVYKSVIHGIALQGVSQDAVDWLKKQEYVNYVEKSVQWSQNTCSSPSSTTPKTYSSNKQNWGLDRITERTRTTAYSYSPSGTGSGTTIYILDNGIQDDHVEFPNSQVSVLSTDLGCTGSGDHGTWVAGVAAGQNLGTAKDAKLKDVKISCTDGAATDDIVDAMDAIDGDVNTGDKCVVIMSYTLDTNSSSVHTATKTITAKCILVAAAGNSNSTASYYPAAYSTEMTQVISVGTINANNKKPCFSNCGSTVDVYAPGTNIWAAHSSSTATNKVKLVFGTSFSAPFVGGVAAIHLGLGVSLGDIKTTIIEDATTSPSIINFPSGSNSNSRILYI